MAEEIIGNNNQEIIGELQTKAKIGLIIGQIMEIIVRRMPIIGQIIVRIMEIIVQTIDPIIDLIIAQIVEIIEEPEMEITAKPEPEIVVVRKPCKNANQFAVPFPVKLNAPVKAIVTKDVHKNRNTSVILLSLQACICII